MDALSTSPLRVASVTYPTSPSTWFCVVVAKVTYRLTPFAASLAPAAEQEPIVWIEGRTGGDPAGRVRVPVDMVPYRTRADVTLVGSAFMPSGEAARSIKAKLGVGTIAKTIELAGGAPGSRIPLPLDGGFGPLAESSPARARLLPSGFTWSPGEWNARPLPEGLDPTFFNAAPPDQQLDELPENARLVLEYLTPSHAYFMTSLPGLRPRAVVEATNEEVAMRADTLWIDTDRQLCTMTWRGRVALRHPQEPGRVLMSLGGPGAQGRAVWGDPAQSNAALAESSETITGSVLGTGRAPLPFAPSAGSAAPPPRVAEGAALPFAPAAESAKPPPRVEELLRPAQSAPVAPAWKASPWATTGDPPAASTPAPSSAPGIVTPSPGPSLSASSPGPSLSASSSAPSLSASSPAPGIVTPSAPAGAPKSATAASNAAVLSGGLSATSPKPQRSGGEADAAAARAPVDREVVELLWFDRIAVARFRGAQALREAFPASAGRGFLKAGEAPAEEADRRERRDATWALTRARPLTTDGLDAALAAAIDEDGAFTAPIVLVAGELALSFDEREALEATIRVVTPLIGADKKLREVVEAAAVLAGPERKAPAEALEAATLRVREAFAEGPRAVAPSYLQTSVERLLLEGRTFQRRLLLGQQRVRGLFTLRGAPKGIPTYLPEAATAELPLFGRFPARAVAELRHTQDERDPHPHALLVLAIGRVLPSAAGKRRE